MSLTEQRPAPLELSGESLLALIQEAATLAHNRDALNESAQTTERAVLRKLLLPEDLAHSDDRTLRFDDVASIPEDEAAQAGSELLQASFMRADAVVQGWGYRKQKDSLEAYRGARLRIFTVIPGITPITILGAKQYGEEGPTWDKVPHQAVKGHTTHATGTLDVPYRYGIGPKDSELLAQGQIQLESLGDRWDRIRGRECRVQVVNPETLEPQVRIELLELPNDKR